jgi:hypothetical protein
MNAMKTIPTLAITLLCSLRIIAEEPCAPDSIRIANATDIGSQQPGPDTIFLKNGHLIEGHVTKLGLRNIHYSQGSSDSTAKVARSNVDHIRPMPRAHRGRYLKASPTPTFPRILVALIVIKLILSVFMSVLVVYAFWTLGNAMGGLLMFGDM